MLANISLHFIHNKQHPTWTAQDDAEFEDDDHGDEIGDNFVETLMQNGEF